MTTIQIGKIITSLLKANSSLVALVGDKIYPLVAKEGTTFPFVVYRRTGIQPQYCKDGLATETASVDVVIASNTYTSSIEVADLVRTALDCKACVYQETTTVNHIEMTTAEEDYLDDTYIQTLNFQFTI